MNVLDYKNPQSLWFPEVSDLLFSTSRYLRGEFQVVNIPLIRKHVFPKFSRSYNRITMFLNP